MEWANYVAEKNEGILFPAEIRVVGSYTDRLLKIPRFKDSPFPVPHSHSHSHSHSPIIFPVPCYKDSRCVYVRLLYIDT